jgi:hypothetical protein
MGRSRERLRTVLERSGYGVDTWDDLSPKALADYYVEALASVWPEGIPSGISAREIDDEEVRIHAEGASCIARVKRGRITLVKGFSEDAIYAACRRVCRGSSIPYTVSFPFSMNDPEGRRKGGTLYGVPHPGRGIYIIKRYRRKGRS